MFETHTVYKCMFEIYNTYVHVKYYLVNVLRLIEYMFDITMAFYYMYFS